MEVAGELFEDFLHAQNRHSKIIAEVMVFFIIVVIRVKKYGVTKLSLATPGYDALHA